VRVIVTGGAGFLGSHVADHLAAAGHEVSVFDQARTERHRSLTGDLLEEGDVAAALKGAEAVCHLGAVGDVYLAAERPSLAAAVNVTGTANVCEAALRESVGRLVVASTWEVYGHPRYQPMDEAHPCEPDHPYNITKLASEQLARAYARLKGIPVVALRLGTAYGTRMRPNSVFSVFIRKALLGEAITIQGSGDQGRQFTHASDIARAFEAALTKGESAAAYNIVADRMITIRGLAEAVTRMIPTSLAYGPPRAGDVPSATVTSERARTALGWTAQVRFESALLELVEEHKKALGAPAIS
jgi:UDP-glucose 4-epimerase